MERLSARWDGQSMVARPTSPAISESLHRNVGKVIMHHAKRCAHHKCVARANPDPGLATSSKLLSFIRSAEKLRGPRAELLLVNLGLARLY